MFFFDELAQLNKMNSFVQLLTLARSKNIAVFAAIQDFGLLRSKYKKDLLESILNNFNTLVAGRLNETETLKWLEQRLGKEEYMRYEEGHSFGPTDFADRLTANRRRMERFAVMSSEIASLPPLTYYLLVDKYLTKASRQYEKFQQIAEPTILYSDQYCLDETVEL
jgi:type IV secretory pathway TraG/TraD family ATPase VirD4